MEEDYWLAGLINFSGLWEISNICQLYLLGKQGLERSIKPEEYVRKMYRAPFRFGMSVDGSHQSIFRK
jgi:hypothetical protein